MAPVNHNVDTRRQPQPWQRSERVPEAVFVPGRPDCTTCMFQHKSNECSSHPCAGGVWMLDKLAVVYRLEV